MLNEVMQKEIEKFELACGKKVTEIIEFPANEKTFGAVDQAIKKAVELGYTVAPMCGSEPIGLAKNVSYIAKWRNIDRGDRKRIEAGILTDSRFRNSDAVLAIF